MCDPQRRQDVRRGGRIYLVKLALRPWRLAPFSQVFSGLAGGFLLLLIGMLVWLQAGLKATIHQLQGEQVITAYLDPALDSRQGEQIADSIRTSLGAEATTEVKVIHAQEFLSTLRERYPELAKEVEDFGSEADALVPKYVSVSGMFNDDALSKIKATSGVVSVESSKERYKHLVGAFRALRWVARLAILGLMLALFTGLIHLSRTNNFLHREAVSILKLWGATEWEQRAPNIVSGALVGLASGLFAVLSWMTLGVWIVERVRLLSPVLKNMPHVSSLLPLVLLLSGPVLGILAGALTGLSHPLGSRSAERA